MFFFESKKNTSPMFVAVAICPDGDTATPVVNPSAPGIATVRFVAPFDVSTSTADRPPFTPGYAKGRRSFGATA